MTTRWSGWYEIPDPWNVTTTSGRSRRMTAANASSISRMSRSREAAVLPFQEAEMLGPEDPGGLHRLPAPDPHQLLPPCSRPRAAPRRGARRPRRSPSGTSRGGRPPRTSRTCRPVPWTRRRGGRTRPGSGSCADRPRAARWKDSAKSTSTALPTNSGVRSCRLRGTRSRIRSAPLGRLPAGVLGDHRDRGRLVEEPQLPARVLRILVVQRVGEDAALEERAVEIRHERPDVAERLGLPGRVVLPLQRAHPLLGLRRPSTGSSPRSRSRSSPAAGIFMSECDRQELPDGRIQRESVHAAPDRVDEHRAGAVQDVAGRELPEPGLEAVLAGSHAPPR